MSFLTVLFMEWWPLLFASTRTEFLLSFLICCLEVRWACLANWKKQSFSSFLYLVNTSKLLVDDHEFFQNNYHMKNSCSFKPKTVIHGLVSFCWQQQLQLCSRLMCYHKSDTTWSIVKVMTMLYGITKRLPDVRCERRRVMFPWHALSSSSERYFLPDAGVKTSSLWQTKVVKK